MWPTSRLLAIPTALLFVGGVAVSSGNAGFVLLTGVLFLPLLARLLGGRALPGLIMEAPAVLLGLLCAVATVILGGGLTAIAAYARAQELWHGPVDEALLVQTWLTGVLFVDLGLALLLTRSLRWRSHRWIAGVLALPGLLATPVLVLALLFGPAGRVDFGLAAKLPGLMALTVMVLGLGPFGQRAVQASRAAALALSGWFVYEMATTWPENGLDVILPALALLCAWHGFAGPHRHPVPVAGPNTLRR